MLLFLYCTWVHMMTSTNAGKPFAPHFITVILHEAAAVHENSLMVVMITEGWHDIFSAVPVCFLQNIKENDDHNCTVSNKKAWSVYWIDCIFILYFLVCINFHTLKLSQSWLLLLEITSIRIYFLSLSTLHFQTTLIICEGIIYLVSCFLTQYRKVSKKYKKTLGCSEVIHGQSYLSCGYIFSGENDGMCSQDNMKTPCIVHF